jgi:hypothetical protein
MIAVAPDASAVLFRMPVWVTGNPLGTDPDPNVTPPAATRIIIYDANAIGAIATTPSLATIRTFAIGGTSIAYNAYRYDSFNGLWRSAPLGARTITLATSNTDTLSNTQHSLTPGARFFLRITAVTGTVTAFGYGFL